MSAMPERVEQPTVDEIQAGTAYITADPVAHKVCNWMIAFGRRDAESRLLAAEARVRELEQIHRDEMDLHDEMEAKLAAERDALVELVRDVACSGVAFEDKRLDYVEIQIDTDTWAQARAILAREET